MEDDLDRFRKQFEAERQATDEARARGEVDRAGQKIYEAAWSAVFRELHRLEAAPESPVNLDPLQALVDELKRWDKIPRLVETREDFYDQLSLGFDSHERTRRAELWLVDALLCLAKSPTERGRSIQLLTEMRHRGFCPFGIAGIAVNLNDRLLNHPALRDEWRKQKRKQMLANAMPVIAKLAKSKPMLRRNLTFVVWTEQNLKPAEIRDRWHSENSKSKLGKGEAALDRIRKGIDAAQEFLKQLADMGFPLTAQEALGRLPKDNGS